jgi:UDP-glucose 4-epimerase
MDLRSENILVTGGAGYIGSHAVRRLVDDGYRVVVVDDLSRGHPAALDERAHFYQHDFGDAEAMRVIMKDHEVDAVLHFAGFIEVGESVREPAKYYENNVVHSISMLNAMREANVSRIVFSSTAAVYGEPEYTPIDEHHPLCPVNPYGESKRMIEQVIQHYADAYGLDYAILRYFNVAGAATDGLLGERHQPETHLIPRILQTALESGSAKVSIYGTDYPTSDGTCIRDYIHVDDLVDAHVLALEALLDGRMRQVYNLGSEHGFTVREVIRACQEIIGRPLQVEEVGRRSGDPAVLVAKSEKIRRQLRWNPKLTDMPSIIATAWRWHQSLDLQRQARASEFRPQV